MATERYFSCYQSGDVIYRSLFLNLKSACKLLMFLLLNFTINLVKIRAERFHVASDKDYDLKNQAHCVLGRPIPQNLLR